MFRVFNVIIRVKRYQKPERILYRYHVPSKCINALEIMNYHRLEVMVRIRFRVKKCSALFA